MLFMIIEHFKNGNATPVYKRHHNRGRMVPDGLEYISSWIDTDLRRCFQVMKTDDRRLLDQWMANWNDLVDFEVIEVLTSQEAAKKAMNNSSTIP